MRRCHEKIAGSVREDGTIAPPCHSLQRLGYCKVNREPGARWEQYDLVFDIERAVEAIPADCPARDLEHRLRPVLEAISHRDPSVHGRYLGLLERRFGLKVRDLRRALTQAGQRRREDDERPPAGDASRAAGADAIEGEIYEDTCCYYTVSGRDETRVVCRKVRRPMGKMMGPGLGDRRSGR